MGMSGQRRQATTYFPSRAYRPTGKRTDRERKKEKKRKYFRKAFQSQCRRSEEIFRDASFKMHRSTGARELWTADRMWFGDPRVSRLPSRGELHPKTNSNMRTPAQEFGIAPIPAFRISNMQHIIVQIPHLLLLLTNSRGFLDTITVVIMDLALSYSAQLNICRRRLIYKRRVFCTSWRNPPVIQRGLPLSDRIFRLRSTC